MELSWVEIVLAPIVILAAALAVSRALTRRKRQDGSDSSPGGCCG